MTTYKMTKPEYWSYLVGVFGLYGLIFFPLLSYYGFEYWQTQPDFFAGLSADPDLTIVDLFAPALIFCTGFALSRDRIHGFSVVRFGLFLLLINLAALGASANRDVLIFLPGGLIGCWICGNFARSAFARVSSSSDASSNKELVFFSSGIVVLVTAAFVGFSAYGPVRFSLDEGAVFVRATVPPGYPQDHRAAAVSTLEEQILALSEVETLKSFAGYTDEDHEFARSLYVREILLELNPAVWWRKGSQRLALVNTLREMELRFPGVKITVLEQLDRPEFALEQASYTFSELQFVPDREALARLGVQATDLNAAMSLKLRLSSGSVSMRDLGTVEVAGKRIALSELGEFRSVKTEYLAGDLPSGKWLQIKHETMPSGDQGFTVYLDEDRLRAFGISLADIDAKIRAGLGTLSGQGDLKALEDLVLVSADDRSASLRLGDIAKVIFGEVRGAQSEVQGVPYVISVGQVR
ncbi:hypothetical protein [Pelagibius sp. Alg239-R121]|uniref:hypothetical protein n=1 Tax=Pelagibius sp. Alg239-R121 TaxID=2993448 RepID=UPI0024A6AA13|nr:hypothetical protein [Pelagibius sp. Alg239-R121]